MFTDHEYKPSGDEKEKTDDKNDGIPKPVDNSGNPMFTDHEYKPSGDEKEEAEAEAGTNNGVPEKVDDSGNPMFTDHEYKPSGDKKEEAETGTNNGIPAPVDDSGNPMFTDHEYKPSEDEKTPEVQDGYASYEEAEAAAKKALENDKINNTFNVRQGADGNYYYVLGYEHKPLVTIDEWLANNTPEKEGKISDNWYDQSKHPFEENKEQKPEEKPGETPEPGVTPTPSVPENHYHENDYANIGAGEGTKEDGKKEDSKEESKENGKKEDSKENGKEEKPEKPDMPAKHEKLGKENTDSPNKKKDKAELPKAGSEAEILTLAAASLSSVAGAFISLKKRK